MADPRPGFRETDADLRVLVVRMSAAGDVVHGLPVVQALRAARPEVHVGWLVEDRFAALLSCAKAADTVFVVPRRAARAWPLRRRLGALAALRRRLIAARFHVALDLQGLTKSAAAAWAARVPRRVGLARPDARELAPLLYTQRVSPGPERTHVVDRNLALLGALGLTSPASGAARFPALDLHAPRVDAFLHDTELTHARFAVLNPGAGWPAKRWAPDRYARLAAGLGRDQGMASVVTWAGPAEEHLARTVVESGGESCIMAPATDLAELWALLGRAALFVGADTGPLHMAAAAGTRCVGLFGPTTGARNGPYGAGHRVLQGHCPGQPGCWSRRGRRRCTCMRRIDPEAVLDACRRAITDSNAKDAV